MRTDPNTIAVEVAPEGVSKRLLWQVEKLAPKLGELDINDHMVVLAILAQLFDARRTAEGKAQQEAQAKRQREAALAIR